MKYTIVSFCFALLFSVAFGQQAELPDYVTRIKGAEDKAAIPLNVAGYNLILNFVTYEDQRPGEGVLRVSRVLGVEIEEARNFLSVAKQALQDHKALTAKTALSICEMDIRSGKDWAGAMTATEQALLEHEAALVDKLASTVAPDLWEKIMALADDARRSTSMLTTDYFKLIEFQPHAPLLAQQCNQSMQANE